MLKGENAKLVIPHKLLAIYVGCFLFIYVIEDLEYIQLIKDLEAL